MNRFLMTITMLGSGLLFAPSAWALSSETADGGSFFSDAVEKSANASIAEIRKTFNKDVLIETYAAVPDAKKAQYAPEKKDEFFAAWVRERADATDLNGIYILVCKDPSVLRIGMGAKTRQSHFTNANRDEVVALMLGKFREKKFDEGLTEGLSLIKKRMSENVSALKTAKSSSAAPAGKSSGIGIGMIGTVILIGLGVWLLFGIFRAFSGGGIGGGSGGGFMTGLMGGLFGAVIGNMMYNSFFGGSAHAGDGDSSSDSGSDSGSGFDSGGGDFGGDSGGGGGDF